MFRLFRTLNVKVPLTTIGFSPEGAAIYLGTENGKILVIDLRALDKAPKAVVVSETGSRIETISIQVRLHSKHIQNHSLTQISAEKAEIGNRRGH